MNRTRSHYIHACSFSAYSVSLRFAHLFRHFERSETASSLRVFCAEKSLFVLFRDATKFVTMRFAS